jgi:phage tail tube protein FII
MAAVIWRRNRAYVNDADYLGLITEGSCEIKRATAELTGLGQPAPINAPTGHFEPLVAKLSFGSIGPAQIRQLSGNDGFINLRLMGKCFTPDVTQGKLPTDEMRTRVAGWIKSIPLPTTSTEHGSEVEVEIDVLHVQVDDTAGTILLIDLANGIVEPAGLA